ncbi:hypothetical protein, partial [Frankia sp. Cj3]
PLPPSRPLPSRPRLSSRMDSLVVVLRMFDPRTGLPPASRPCGLPPTALDVPAVLGAVRPVHAHAVEVYVR